MSKSSIVCLNISNTEMEVTLRTVTVSHALLGMLHEAFYFCINAFH